MNTSKLLQNDVINQIPSAIEECINDFISKEETARILDISVDYLYQLTCKNKIPHIRINGKKIKFKKDEVLYWDSIGRPDMSSIDSIKFRSIKINKDSVYLKLNRDTPIIIGLDTMYQVIFSLIDRLIEEYGIKSVMSKIMFHFIKK